MKKKKKEEETSMKREEREEDGVVGGRSAAESTCWGEGFVECGDDGAVGGAYASGGGENEAAAD